MRRNLVSRCTATVCGLLTLGLGQSALAGDKYIDLEPPETKSGLGYGYNSISREFVLRQCVQFNPSATEAGYGASGEDFKFSSIISNAQLADEMDLSVNAKFSASMGLASVSASSKLNFFSQTVTNFMTHTILASYRRVDPMNYIGGDITLKPEYLAMVGTPEFRQKCGDYVIIGEQQGRWFFGTVQLVVRDTATENKMAASGLVEASYGTASASADLNTIKKLKQASNSQDLQIRVTSSGNGTASLNIDQFLAQVQSFPSANGQKQTYKLKAVPIESIVANWPVNNVLAPITDEQKLGVVAEAAWGLTALIADSDFVTQRPTLFALGTTPAKRDARVAHMKARRSFYQSQLDAMRSQAKNCDVDWKGSAACESLYNKWKTWTDFAVAEYDQFPARYVSDCYATRDASSAARDALRMAPGLKNGNFSNTRGDREMANGPVQFDARLSFKPDFTGGDPLGTRKLLANLHVKMVETKPDHTTFEARIQTPVYDLSKPDLANGSSLALDQCAYRDLGVKADVVKLDAAGCNALTIISQAAADECHQAMNSAQFHGLLSSKTGKSPRNETFTSGSRGVLSSMSCTPDGKGHDTNNIGCTDINLRSIQLNLVNTQDVYADAWTKPTTFDQVVIPMGIIPQVALSNLVRKKVATPKPVPPKTPATNKGCKLGKTLIKGDCVPGLKR